LYTLPPIPLTENHGRTHDRQAATDWLLALPLTEDVFRQIFRAAVVVERRDLAILSGARGRVPVARDRTGEDDAPDALAGGRPADVSRAVNVDVVVQGLRRHIVAMLCSQVDPDSVGGQRPLECSLVAHIRDHRLRRKRLTRPFVNDQEGDAFIAQEFAKATPDEP
jgi:hypothetical protein